jgi:hypothetical protein
MATTWGGWSGHMRVGIDAYTSAIVSGTTSVTMTIDFWIQIDSTWNFGDAQTLNIGGPGATSVNFTNNLGPNQTLKVATLTFPGQTLSYGGGPSWTWSGTISGHYQGATPTHSRTYTLPARIPQVPNQPGLTVSSVTADAATFTISVPNSNGATIDDYDIQIDTNSSFSSVDWTLDGNGTKTGLAPATTYYARARAHHSVGYSAWSTTRSFTTGAEPPTVPQSFVLVGSAGQTTASIDWTYPANDGGSAVEDYDVQVATNSGFTTGLQTFTSTNSSYDFTGLTPGTQYWTRVRATNGVGSSPYTSSLTFTTLAGTPVIITPAAGATVSNGIASVVLEALGIASGRTITAEFSQDPTFATGVQTATLSPAGASGNNQYTVTDATDYQKTGTWYVRAKVTNTSTGYVTPWSTTVSYTQSHTPSATIVTPAAGKTIAYAATTTFTWGFVDAAGANDAQTAYQLVIENNATGEVIYDSTKTASAVNSVQRALDAALKNVTLRWRVKVWDRGDTESAWTGYTIFTLADPPVITILSPSSGLPVGTGAPTFAWTANIPSGGTQASAELHVYETGTSDLVWSSTVIGQTFSITPPTVILRNNEDYYFTLKVTDSKELHTTVTANFSTEYEAPDTVPYIVDAGDIDESGYVAVDWSTANPDPLFAMWKIYRKDALAEQWTLITTIPDQNTRTYYDYMLVAGETYSYAVTQVATRSGVLLESSVGYYLDEEGVEQTENRIFDMELSYYWLINPDAPDQSLRLPNVVSNDSTLEFEDATYNIIGRGRHRDYGDELGITGTITCQSREHNRRNVFKASMEAIRRSKETYYLRTPFGQLIPVALGNLGWTPIAGVGTSEMGDMSIPYEEVH